MAVVIGDTSVVEDGCFPLPSGSAESTLSHSDVPGTAGPKGPGRGFRVSRKERFQQ